jgi:hypothetical protein
MDAAARVRRGIAMVMEGRRVFEHLTVHENLVAGGYTRGTKADYARVYEFLPGLASLRSRQVRRAMNALSMATVGPVWWSPLDGRSGHVLDQLRCLGTPRKQLRLLLHY